MFGWLKSVFEGSGAGQTAPVNVATVEKAEALMAAGKEEVAGLNFKSAIDAHLKWKTRLRAVIDGVSDEHLDPKTIMVDNQCVLGKWLHGPGGAKFGEHPGFKELCADHARSHRSAAEVLELALAGRKHEAVHAIEKGDYRLLSCKVTGELAGLFVELDA